MNIATRIESVCTKVLNKKKEFSAERKRIDDRSVFLKMSKRDRDSLDRYLEDMCRSDNIKPETIRAILR